MRKSSQVSLEFLATYAWAFLIIGISVSALYYYGIFDFGKYLPQKCSFPSQFKCLDFSLRPNEVRIKLVNNLGEDICVKSVQITSDAATPISCALGSQSQGSCAASEFEWTHATDKDIVFSSCTGGAYIADTRADLKVTMNYYAVNTPSKPVHIISGKINGKVLSS